jgi:hypothetical protein
VPLYTNSFPSITDAGPLTVGGDVSVTGNLHVTGAALGEVVPANQNLVAWTYDPSSASNSTQVTLGTVYLCAVYVQRTVAITKMYWQVASATGGTPTSNQNVIGLFNSSGTLLQSAVIDADISSTGLKTATISSQSVTAGSMYWVGFVFNAGTAPTVARTTAVTGTGTLVNVGLTAASFRFAVNGTGQTTLASITPSNNTATTFAGPWAAIGV